MSGVLKSVGKVFKKVVTSKVFKIAAIAAAVYFTGGLAMAASGSQFAAGLPGIQGLGGALGMDFAGGAAGAAGSLASTAGLGAEEIGMGAADAVGGAAGSGSAAAGLAQDIGDGMTAGAPQGGYQTATAGAGGVTPSNVSSAVKTAAGPGSPGGAGTTSSMFGLNDSAQKVLFESLGGGAKAMLGAYAAGKTADAAVQNAADDRAWHDKNRATVDMTGSYRNTYKTPGVIKATQAGG